MRCAKGAPPPPLCKSNARVRATAGVVSAASGTASYFALWKYAPVSAERSELFPCNSGVLVLLWQDRGGGGGVGCFGPVSPDGPGDRTPVSPDTGAARIPPPSRTSDTAL